MDRTGNAANDPESGPAARLKALSSTYLRAKEIVDGDYNEYVPLDYPRKRESTSLDKAGQTQQGGL